MAVLALGKEGVVGEGSCEKIDYEDMELEFGGRHVEVGRMRVGSGTVVEEKQIVDIAL